MHFCRLLIYFQNQHFQKKNPFRNAIRLSNSVNPAQARRFVGPDLGTNCLERFSADEIEGKELTIKQLSFLYKK